MIRLNHVSRFYPSRAEAPGGIIRALDDFTLRVEAGEWIAVMGPSGSGKSTLVNLMGCLDRPNSGEILLDGENVGIMSRNELNRVRAEKIGFIFQQFHLIPYLSAVENVMLAQYFHSMTDEQEAREALARMGLKDRADLVPAQLSGGEQQRVCIARALINDPKIILADEPTGNLDAKNEEIVLQLLRDLHDQGRTIVMVTLDPVVARLSDRRIELHDALKPAGVSVGDGSGIVDLPPRGRQRAADIIRRHRLAERLFTDSLAMDSETEIEQQACKFEHILSPEATEKICTFLGHPKTCPHGAPIPRGQCCGANLPADVPAAERERVQ